jgi:hypothetical protein
MDKIKNTTIWDKIIRVSVIMGAILFLLTTIYNGYNSGRKRIVAQERETQGEITQQNSVKELTETVSTMILKVDTLMDNQTKIMTKMDANTKATNAVIVGFKKHLKATDRLEELLNFYEF